MAIQFYKETSFKETLLGIIPNDWEIIALDDFVEVETGKRMKGGGLTKGTVASIGGEHIDGSGNIIWENMKFISDDFYENLTKGKVKLGDILLVKDGATTGKVALVKNLFYPKVAVNEHVFIIRSKSINKLSNVFLFYLIFSHIGQKQIKLRFHGMIGGIKKEELKSIRIPLPPIQEQQAIAEILSIVDEAIQKTNEIIAKTERLKKGLMQELLTKGIGHKEFKDTEIGSIPKEWEVVRLCDIASIKGRIGWHGLKDENYLTKGEYYLVRGIDFENGKVLWEKCVYVSKEWYEKDPNIQLKEGDILITKDGTIGKVALIRILPKKATLGTGIFRIRLKTDKCLSQYLYYIFNSSYFERFIRVLSAGSTLSHLYQRDLIDFKFPLPSLSEQQKIAEILSTIYRKLEIERKEKEKLERIKHGLMDLLLTGKIRIRVS